MAKKKPHEKKRLARGVVLESRRYIGFARTPVQNPDSKPIIDGLPIRHTTDYD